MHAQFAYDFLFIRREVLCNIVGAGSMDPHLPLWILNASILSFWFLPIGQPTNHKIRIDTALIWIHLANIIHADSRRERGTGLSPTKVLNFDGRKRVSVLWSIKNLKCTERRRMDCMDRQGLCKSRVPPCLPGFKIFGWLGRREECLSHFGGTLSYQNKLCFIRPRIDIYI